MPRIIRYQLAGRLGNQLFQWAFAHRIALEKGHQVQFTVDRFHHPKGLSEYQLGNLICDHILEPKKLNSFGLMLVILDKLKKTGEILVSFSGNLLYRETHADPPAENISEKTSFLTGYFINKLHVERVQKTLSSDFCGTLSAIFERKWKAVLPEKYEAIHVRKGDFKFYQDSYGVLSNEYYVNAVQKNLPLVFVTDFCEESEDLINLLKPDLIFDSSNSSAWDALAIMSQAEILHISNSTLSWWGGFGAIEFGKKVYLPSPFYKSLSALETNEIFKLDKFQISPSHFI